MLKNILTQWNLCPWKSVKITQAGIHPGVSSLLSVPGTAILEQVSWTHLWRVSVYFPRCLSSTPEKVMELHSSTLAWKIPWTEEPDRLQSMGLRRVRHDWETSLSLFTFLHWRRKWQPTPMFLPGESQGQGSLVGCSLCGRTELDTTKAT